MKRTKPQGYALATGPGDAPGLVAYRITAPDGSTYCAGQRADTEQAVAAHYQRTVKRLNAQCGFSSPACIRTTLSNGHPTALHTWKQPIKRQPA